MKPLVPIAVAALLAIAANAAMAQALQSPPPGPTVAPAPISQNEAAGLPDLDAINRAPGTASAKVDLNTPREPSFHQLSGNGTEITEFRDRGKPVEIDVKSNFGTRYQMSAPIDAAPTTYNSGKPSTRLPSINLRY
jgi:hypothetical protein